MPGQSDVRLNVSVGKREFEDLTGAWAAYLEVTQSKDRPIDPVLAMQRTGSVLRSVEAVLATLDGETEKPKESAEGQ
jgi:hypothetical protein